VLRSVSLTLRPGEIVALVGPSGAGKSTLLHVAGLLERPDGGEVWLEGKNCGALSDIERTRMRCKALGFVYQFHHLLPEFSALENVMVPQMIAGAARAAARKRAGELLALVGLEPRASHRPARLSGGEQQRVAVARAVILSPQLILADEPTGDLDTGTGEEIQELLFNLNQESGIAMVVATHNRAFAEKIGRQMELREGRLYPFG
jgi:lipoprotein-releasing system ATP-binding protein